MRSECSKPQFAWVLVAGFLAGLLPTGNAGADQASHRQAVETLFRLTHMEQNIQKSVDNVVELQLRQAPQMGEQRQLLKAFIERYAGWDALKADLIEMYMSEFTEAELNEMNAFYITPTGQKVLTRLPLLVGQRNTLAMERMQQHIGELQREMAKTSRPGRASQP